MPNIPVTKALQKRNDAALEAFHKYYSGIYGEERWQSSLFVALSEPTRHAALINKFANSAETLERLASDSRPLKQIFTHDTASLPLVVTTSDDAAFPQPFRDPSSLSNNPSSHWMMDLASVIAAVVLDVRAGDKVLDMCASPGGKSIVLSQMLFRDTAVPSDATEEQQLGHLHSNEIDQARNKRLAQNLQSYLPENLFASGNIKVLRVDGTANNALAGLPFSKEGYDKILIDAPCSSERHIIHAHLKASSSKQISQELVNWKASHSTTLAKTQVALLTTAFKALKIGGSLVYATCSLSNEENDNVVDRAHEALKRLHKKTNLNWDIVVDRSCDSDPNLDFMLLVSEQTKHGRIALPDIHATDRWGPLYFAKMRKVPRT